MKQSFIILIFLFVASFVHAQYQVYVLPNNVKVQLRNLFPKPTEGKVVGFDNGNWGPIDLSVLSDQDSLVSFTLENDSLKITLLDGTVHSVMLPSQQAYAADTTHWVGGASPAGTVTFDTKTTFDTLVFPASFSPSFESGITYYDTLSQIGSSYSGWIVDQAGVYEVSWQGNYVPDAANTNYRYDFNWTVDGDIADPLNNHIRTWYAEVLTRQGGHSTTTFYADAGSYIQLTIKASSVSLTEISLRGFHIAFHRISN